MKNKNIINEISLIVLLVDQIIKVIITYCMNINQQIIIIPNFFSLYYVRNTGAAFSILENNTFLLIIISVVFLIVLKNYIKKEKTLSSLSMMSFGIIIGGIYGNLVDRIVRYSVIDYISIKFIKYQFPIFNLADIAITAGVLLLLIDILQEENKKKEEKKHE